MKNIKELINFKPTDLQKAKVDHICRQVINYMSGLTIQEKALTLKTLVDAFEDVLLKGEYLG